MKKNFAMIPARMGSQRLKQKNLRELGGVPLITRAIRKCRAAGVFDEIWVNSEHPAFGEIAAAEGVGFHQRPAELGNNQATSEQFVREFLEKHPCDYVYQVHSIAPLLTVPEIAGFVRALSEGEFDALLSYEPIQIECALEGRPVNFTFNEKTNSQELRPVQRIAWSITGWRRAAYLAAAQAGQCATYAGRVGFHPVSHVAAHVIKTEEDLALAEALLALMPPGQMGE
jgi:CMP-N-acetylneuraminic acid synthetase